LRKVVKLSSIVVMVGSGAKVRWKKLRASGCSGVKKSAVKLLAAVATDLRGYVGVVRGAPGWQCLVCGNWIRPNRSEREKEAAEG
jgi:hypothetical protein